MANFSLENFVAEINKSGVAKPSKFEIEITPPPSLANYAEISKLASVYCEVANFPSLTINTKQHQIYGPAYQRPVGSDYGGDGISVSFLVDKDMNIKKFFESWMFSIVDTNSYNLNYQSSYTTQIKISQLDEADNIKYSIKLIDAFPRNISDMGLNSSAVNAAHKLSVVFAYRKWIPDIIFSNTGAGRGGQGGAAAPFVDPRRLDLKK
jgi:hypothetical protein